jgi:hypothetical protein
VDPSRFPLRGYPGAVFDGAARRAHHLSRRFARVLGNILLLGVLLYWTWGHAVRAKLLKDDATPDIVAAICRRILIGQSLYALGAALCVFNTYWSIAFIALVQVTYVVGLTWAFRR